MAKLLPSSNSAIVKYQKSAVSNTIRPNKLLNIRSKTTAVKGEVAKEPPRLLGSSLSDIEKKIIQVDKLLKDSLLLSKKEDETKRKSKEKEKFEGKEKELEKKKPLITKGVKLPSPPKIGFLGWIKNFITQTILGFFAVRLIDFLPQLLKILPVIIKVGDFFIDVGGKMLDGLITFVDWGYKAIDGTRQFIKQLGGEGLAQNFDKFAGAIDNVIEIAIIAALATADSGGFGDKGPDVSPKKPTGKPPRGPISQLGRKAFVSTLGKGGAKTVLKFIRPFTKRLPIIGGLLDFGLSVALGEKIGRAAFRAIGATLLGAVGAAVGGPFALLTGLAGGTLGDIAGGALYDLFFENKKPKGKTVKAAGGGKPATRGGKPVSGPAKRTVKKKKTPRTLRATPSKLKPGGVVGGEKKIKQLYPEAKDKSKMSPFDFLKNSYNTFAKSSGLGALVALAIKPIMGDKPTYADYKNAGTGINNWMNQSIGSGTFAYAGGGEVKMESIVSGEDYSDVIAKSLQDSVAPQVDKTIQDLMKQLMLQKIEQEKAPTPKQDPSIEVGPGGVVTGGNADFWALVAIASLESGTPQGRADVAQSIYNRLASGIYSGKTIKELIVAGNGRQYQPVGRAVNEFRAINDKESAINAVMVANKLSRAQAEKFINDTASAIQNPDLQKSAAQFVGGRTDFWAEGLTPPSDGVGYVVRHGHRFGWFVGPAAIAYGKKNPGPARAPALGDIKVMGGAEGIALGKGYGSAGSKIAGELGRYIKQKLKQGPDFQAVTEHPEHGGVGPPGSHAPGSYHFSGRAIDVGAYAHEQPKILRVISEFNKLKGVKPVELLKAGDPGHSDHVHVAYEKGGKTRGVPHFAMLGEKGVEFVIDADSTAALEGTYPGFLDALNKAKYKDAIRVLQSYTNYEQPEPEIVYVPVPTSDSGGVSGGMTNSSLTYDNSTIDTMGEQMSDNLMYG